MKSHIRRWTHSIYKSLAAWLRGTPGAGWLNQNFMKTAIDIPALIAMTAMTMSAWSQSVYSSNAVGYVNLPIYAGDNLIANQLSDSPDNTLDTIFAGAGVLPGSTFSEWSPSANQLMPLSVFDGTSWSCNYSLSPDGTGGVLNSPGNTTVTLVGDVVNVNLLGGGYTFVPPARGPGTYLLGLAAPLAGATFAQVIGSDPVAGDSVETLNAQSQTYAATTFNGTAWDNGAPSLEIGEAAYFDLVPEPSVFALIASGAGLLTICRSSRAKIGDKAVQINKGRNMPPGFCRPARRERGAYPQ